MDLGFGGLGSMFTGAALGMIMLPVTVLQFIAFAYFIIVVDRRNENSKSKGDTQVGLKLALHAIATLGIVIASAGVTTFLAWALSGGEGGSGMVKSAIAMILGSAGFVFVCRTALAQSNNASYPQTERFSMGALVIGSGLISMATLIGLLFALFFEAKWKQGPAQLLAAAVVYGSIFWFMLKAMLGSGTGGWTGIGASGMPGASGGTPAGGAPYGGAPYGGTPYGGAPYQGQAAPPQPGYGQPQQDGGQVGFAPTAYPGAPAGYDPNRR